MPTVRHALNAAAAGSVAWLLCATPASASGQIFCDATDGSGASIEIAVGHLPILAVLGATATDGSQSWATNPSGDQTPMIYGQGFSGDNRVLVDFTDPNVEQVVVSLRLFQVATTEGFAEAGVLSFGNGAVFPVACDNG